MVRDDHLYGAVADVLKLFDTADRSIVDCALGRLGLPEWFWCVCVHFSFHAQVRLRFKLVEGLGSPWCRCGGVRSVWSSLSRCMSRGVAVLSHSREIGPQLYADKSQVQPIRSHFRSSSESQWSKIHPPVIDQDVACVGSSHRGRGSGSDECSACGNDDHDHHNHDLDRGGWPWWAWFSRCSAVAASRRSLPVAVAVAFSRRRRIPRCTWHQWPILLLLAPHTANAPTHHDNGADGDLRKPCAHGDRTGAVVYPVARMWFQAHRVF